jgi:hypothetical protein
LFSEIGEGMRGTLKKVLLLVLMFLSSMGAVVSRAQDNKPLKGVYIGQEPPGKKPKIFAPGFVSTSDILPMKISHLV